MVEAETSALDDTSDPPIQEQTAPHDDPEWIEYQYHKKGLTMAEIGSKAGVSESTISRRMSEYKIPTKHYKNPANCRAPSLRRDTYGYMIVNTSHRDTSSYLTLHRLHATLLVEDISDLAGMDIHHRNGCRFDNRLENYDIVEKDWHVVESQKASRLPPYKGLCRDCGHVSYYYDTSNTVYCPGCAEAYDPHIEIVRTQHIDWGTI